MRVVAFALVLGAAFSAAAQPAPSSPTVSTPTRITPVDEGALGVGIVVGNTLSGLSGRVTIGGSQLQAAVGTSALGNDLRLHLDVVHTFARWDATDGQYALKFLAGLGAQAAYAAPAPERAAHNGLGLRLPLGAAVLIRDNPVELFFEVAPDVGWSASAGVGRLLVVVDGALGLRYVH